MCAHNATPSIPANRKCWTLLVALTNSVVNTVCSLTFFQTICIIKSAFNRRFFVSAAGLILSLLCLPVVANPNCQIKEPYKKVQVDYVIDGDTVVLSNGEKVRLIGIDTPEISRNSKPSQAYALVARDFLRGLLVRGHKYILSYGIERQDRHGRTLGHLFRENGHNLQTEILARGYATPLNIPPNILFANCYRKKTNVAISNKLGLWKLKQYQERPANTLSRNDTGYRIVSGHITQISNSASSIWLKMNKYLAIRINRNDLKFLPDLNFTELKGQKIKVRGKIYIYNKQLRMNLRHSHDLETMND
jgi:endonuclease YncB( thermonuclease family)